MPEICPCSFSFPFGALIPFEIILLELSFFSNFENRLADALQELQENTIEMERNRVIPELVELYNVENAAHKLLPQAKYLTKLIGSDNKRVITAFNPSESIECNALNGPYTGDNAVAIVGQESERLNLEGPLHWDQNWTWDF